jgi:tetratricopeptide (TPR) repeat protein
VAERPRRRRDDSEDNEPRPSRAGGSGRGARRSGAPRREQRAQPRGRPPRRDSDAGRRSTGGKRTSRSADDRNPTRSGIQYPPRRTVRRGASEEVAPQSRRPVLRTVKGKPSGPAPRRAKKTITPDKARTRAVPRRRRRATEAADELARLAGRNARSAQDQLARAAEAFAAGRERDAARLLRPLRDAYPDAAAVRELLGLVHYRLGHYPAATKELGAFVELTGSVEQHPVLMDSWRAQRRYDKVEELWQELAQSSPSGALVTEGRIVLAGAEADRGRLRDAIATLSRRADDIKRVQDFHLRLWYALADLYERAGEIPRARDYFGRVSSREPDFADVAERLAALA